MAIVTVKVNGLVKRIKDANRFSQEEIDIALQVFIEMLAKQISVKNLKTDRENLYDK